MTTIIVIFLLVFCFVALLAEDFPGLFQRRNQNRKGSPKGTNRYSGNYNQVNINDIYCPECGSPNVTVYRDGSCECQDCEFQFHVDYL